MAENSFPFCDGVTLISVDPTKPDVAHHWLEYAAGNGVTPGPYRIPIVDPLMSWATRADPGERMEVAFRILRIHMGEESAHDEKDERVRSLLAKIPRASEPSRL